MKKLILLLFSITILVSCITTTPLEEDPQVLRVVETDKSKEELYRLSNEWMVESFRSSDEVIEYSDKTEGVIMGKGYTSFSNIMGENQVWYTIKLETKDNRARINIYDFYLITYVGTNKRRGEAFPNKESWDQSKDKIIAIADDYEDYIKSKTEDW